jgi:hypothetical protein
MVFFSALFFKLLGARATRRARDYMRLPAAPAIEAKIDFQIEIVPADGTGAAK